MSCLTKVLNSKIRNIEKIPTEESIKDTSNARKLRCRILASFIPKKVGIFLKFKTSNDIRKIEIAIERHSFIKDITSVNNFASTITKSNLNSPQPAYSENRNTEICPQVGTTLISNLGANSRRVDNQYGLLLMRLFLPENYNIES